MTKIIIFFLRIGIIKSKPKSVQKWADQKNHQLIKYAAEKGDFWCRKEVAKILADFEYNFSIPLLLNLLHDKVFSVVEVAIETLNKNSLSRDVKKEIEVVISYWENRHKEIKKNWEKPMKSSPGATIDKSQMKRLAKLKELMGKPKGSMSIG